MGKYLKLFENHTEYEEARENLILPNVSLCTQENEVHYNPYVETRLVVYYDIQDISAPTPIFTNYDSSVKSIEIDGKETISEFSQGNVTYQFDSIGEHVIKYEFNNPTTVGNNAPLLYNLTTAKRVVIPNTFTAIGPNAFLSCSGLEEIYYNAQCEINTSFRGWGNALKKVVIGDSTPSIGTQAFSGCSSLTSCTIGNGVTSISTYAFDGCSGLTSCTIGSGVTSIASDAFRNCTSLTSIEIPNSVTSIAYNAFNSCSGLTSVTIPNSVTNIDAQAFGGCSGLEEIYYNAQCELNISFRDWGSNLKKVVIGDSTPSIIANSFSSCSGLVTITVDSNNSIYDSRDNCNAIIETATNTLIVGCNTTVIPDSVTSIGWNAFNGRTSLTSIDIPNSVTSIGSYAFQNCSSLTSITIPDSVTSINWGVFQDCSSLTSIDIPDSVTSIDDFAFSRCSGLTSCTIGSGVTSISTYAFAYCSSLRSITSLATTAPTIQSSTFRDVTTGGVLTVPSGSSGYDVWMGTGDYYLGKYGWTKVEQ